MILKFLLFFAACTINSISSLNLNQSVLINKFGYSSDSVLIDLSGKSIETIDILTFKGLQKLKYLYLEDNKIKKLENNLFKDLIDLKELWLEDNNILAVDKNAFNGLKNLEIVCFNNNPVSVLFPNVVSSLCYSNSKCNIKIRQRCQRAEITTTSVLTTKISTITRTPTNYWSFNGDLNDSVGGAHVFYGANYSLTNDRFNNPNSAVSLNTGYLQLPQAYYFDGDFTFTAWVYFRSYGIWPRIFDFGNGYPESNVFLAINTTRKLVAAVYNGRNLGSVQSSDVFELNKWQHVAFTSQSLFIYLYINGQMVENRTSVAAPKVTRLFNYFGRSNWYGIGADTHTNGIFDEIKIYNVCLTYQEIINEYNSQK